MQNPNDLLTEAIGNLVRYTGLQATIAKPEPRKNAIVDVAGQRFVVQTTSEITKGNKGLVMKEIQARQIETGLPVLLVTSYLPVEIAQEYGEGSINFLDLAGNCRISQNHLVLHIEGKKLTKRARVKQTRAFQEAGLRLIFLFLLDPALVNLPYRELARRANIALGSVAAIMQELIEQRFVAVLQPVKKLKNTDQLLQKWVTAYHDVLRPRLMKKRMRFINSESHNQWHQIDLSRISHTTYWGGESAANLITSYLQPGTLTIYTEQTWQVFKEIGLVPDQHGTVEVLETFWTPETYQGVPPLLVYADLISSSSERNIETANLIQHNELQYLQRTAS